jgi:sulfoxide reductase catalytic subunit YedY
MIINRVIGQGLAMIIKTKKHIPASEITDPLIFAQRRKIIKAVLASVVAGSGIAGPLVNNQQKWKHLPKAANFPNSLLTTPIELVKNYTNYYEFSFDKEEPAILAQTLRINPWQVEITGEVEKAATFNLEDILNSQNLEEHVYRFRCVEGWSMVVPWVGFPLVKLLNLVKPLSSAKFVKFTSIMQPENMPFQRNKIMLDWPYIEGLRIDEATHPLTILAVGMYGNILPKQNGAPLRLVVPWKYGFKSIKAIVKIELLKKPPITSWNKYAPNEYGFYANVNPSVPHPRWSQISERQLGSSFFTPRRKTELFNGYGEQVASMYADMDLRHFI